MWSSLVEYHQPKRISAALKLLDRSTPRTVPLAGGVWLVARRDPSIQAVVDLSALGLDFIEPRKGRLRLGAITTLQTLADHPILREFAGGLIRLASRASAPRPIRNVATLGGTLVAADSTSEIGLALLALEAQVVVRTPNRNVVNLDSFFADPVAQLPSHALITEVSIPIPSANIGTALADIRRTPKDRPIVNAVALVSLQRGTIRKARLALGGVAPRPIRLSPVEAALPGHSLNEAKFSEIAALVREAISPPSDGRASAEYRREMASVVALRALREAWEGAKE